MVTLDEPPLTRRYNYIILLIIILSILYPRLAHESFDICCPPPPKVGWDSDTIEAPLLVIAKEFAPEVKLTKNISYGNGSCVPYARAKTGIQLTGWAGSLLDRAGEAGYATSSRPTLSGMVITNESNGHVAVVEKITEESIVVSEQNYAGRYIISTREIPLDSSIIKGYIHE